MFINVPYVRVSIRRFTLVPLSRDNDTDLRQLSRNCGFKWLNNTAEKRRQPSEQRALDTLTAYITVNVDAIEGKRLKGGWTDWIQAETRDTVEGFVELSAIRLKRNLRKKLNKKTC